MFDLLETTAVFFFKLKVAAIVKILRFVYYRKVLKFKELKFTVVIFSLKYFCIIQKHLEF